MVCWPWGVASRRWGAGEGRAGELLDLGWEETSVLSSTEFQLSSFMLEGIMEGFLGSIF